MGTQYIGIKRFVDIGITNPKWYLGLNFLLLGSILLPGEIKSIIVHSINMVVLVMPRQTIKNNKSHWFNVDSIDIKLKGAVLQPLL